MQEVRYISFFRKKTFSFLLPNESVSCIIPLAPAGVMELVDVVDSKSTAGDSVPVRVRSPAPRRSKVRFAPTFFFAKERHPHAPLLLLSKSNPLRWASIWVD